VFFTAATSAGRADRSNEDWVAVTSDLAVVLDGATARTDTGCIHGVAWYTRKLGAGIIAAAAVQSRPLTEVLADTIRDVTALHPDCDLTHPGTPSAATAIVRLEGETLRYLVLGDITVVLDTTSDLTVVRDDRVSQTAATERARSDQFPIGAPEKQAALVEMKHAELAARNQPGGYWIAATDPVVVAHALTGETPAAQVRRLAVLSDGAARAVELFHHHTWSSALDALEREGPQRFIDQVRTAEHADPFGEQHPRNKNSDDATVILAAP
jgi:hypothetical protein